MPISGASASILSVANLTRADGAEFLEVAARVPVKTPTTTFPLACANEALDLLRAGRIEGAAVLVPGGDGDEIPQAGRERPRGLGNLAGLVADLRRRRRGGRGRAPASTAPSSSASTSSTPPTSTAAAPPRPSSARRSPARPRDSYILATKLFFPMTDSRPRPLRRPGRKAARRLAEAPQDRPCRSLPMPPLRRGDAARGDDAGADPRGRKRQGALYRLFRMAGRARSRPRSTSPASPASSPASRNIPCSGARPEKEVIPLCAANGISQIVWSPLAQGRAHRQIPPGRAAPAGQPRRPATRWATGSTPGSRRRCSKRCRS